jgi:hypothetical protein
MRCILWRSRRKESSMMNASARLSGRNWLPLIVHTSGAHEVLSGPPLVNRKTALKYAQLEINSRHARGRQS